MTEEVPYSVEPEVAGRTAFYNGSANPYPKDHPNFQRWLAGYTQAGARESARAAKERG